MSADLLQQIQAEITGLSGSCELTTLRAYSRDCWPIYQFRYWERPITQLPGAVVWPTHSEQVAALFAFACKHKIPVTPLGLGSGVCGGAVPEEGAIVLDLRFMDALFAIDTQSNLARAGVGWNGQNLEDRLNKLGYTTGHFPSSIMMSSLGGWLAARSAGQLSTRYGKFEDRVRGVRWVYPNGESEWLDCDGYQGGVLELLMGSEGVFGAATEVEFRIDPLPESQVFMAYDFNGVESAIGAMRRLLQAGLRPAVLRLYDPIDSLLHIGFRRGPKNQDQGLKSGGITVSKDSLARRVLRQAIRLLFEHPQAAQALLERLSRRVMLIMMFEGPAQSVSWQANEAQTLLDGWGQFLGDAPARAWYAKRYSITGKQADILAAGGFFDTMEVAFPWSRLYDGYEAVRNALRGHVLLMAHFSHAYADGACIYFTFAGYLPSRQDNERHYLEVWRLALEAVLRAGGTITHHHGVGLLKAKWLAEEWQGGHNYLRLLKSAIDPLRVANPGKLGL